MSDNGYNKINETLADEIWAYYQRENIPYVSKKTISSLISYDNPRDFEAAIKILKSRGQLTEETFENESYYTFFDDKESIKKNIAQFNIDEQKRRMEEQKREEALRQKEKEQDQKQKQPEGVQRLRAKINAYEQDKQAKYSEIFLYEDEVFKMINDINQTGKSCSVLTIRVRLSRYDKFTPDHVLKLLEHMQDEGKIEKDPGDFSDLSDNTFQQAIQIGLIREYVSDDDVKGYCTDKMFGLFSKIVEIDKQIKDLKEVEKTDQKNLESLKVKFEVKKSLGSFGYYHKNKVLNILNTDLGEVCKKNLQIDRAKEKVEKDNQKIQKLTARRDSLYSQFKPVAD